jgi:hypothetical protein
MGQVGDQFQSSDGRWHDSANAANDANLQLNAGSSGSSNAMASAGAGAMAGGMVVGLMVLLFIPSIIMKVFDWIVALLLGFAGVVGRVILSALMGTILWIAMLIIDDKLHLGIYDNTVGNVTMVLLINTVFISLAVLWMYFSHYFTMKAMLAKNIETMGKVTLYVKPFAIAFYGFIVLGIINSVAHFPEIIMWIPLAASVIYYTVQGISVSKAAKEDKKEIGAKPFGVIFAVILACILPYILTTTGAKKWEGKTSGEFQSRLNEAGNGMIINKYLGKSVDVIVPGTFKNLPVVGIRGFRYSDIQQITLPESLKFIDFGAFQESEITSIVIPEGVTDIADSAFKDCENLTSVTFPSSLKRIGDGAFSGCKSLTEIKIPSGHTISYGSYTGTPSPKGVFIADLDFYFLNRSDDSKSFKGCSRLSAASRQALKDSGYIGEF